MHVLLICQTLQLLAKPAAEDGLLRTRQCDIYCSSEQSSRYYKYLLSPINCTTESCSRQSLEITVINKRSSVGARRYCQLS